MNVKFCRRGPFPFHLRTEGFDADTEVGVGESTELVGFSRIASAWVARETF